MASGCAVMRSVLNVDGKSFDVVLSDKSLSWGHVGIEESGLGKKISHSCHREWANTENIKNFFNNMNQIVHCKMETGAFQFASRQAFTLCEGVARLINFCEISGMNEDFIQIS